MASRSESRRAARAAGSRHNPLSHGSALVLAPVPVVVALIVTAKPVYPGDACFYGAPPDAVRWTDDYLGLMVPLAASSASRRR